MSKRVKETKSQGVKDSKKERRKKNPLIWLTSWTSPQSWKKRVPRVLRVKLFSDIPTNWSDCPPNFDL